MGKSWDGSKIAYDVALWREALRVAKPGAHLLAFGGTRTFHRLAVAIEDAGWEVRDCLSWLYGSGFPKSHNVALSIDKMQGHPNRGRAIPTASTFQASDKDRAHRLTSNPVGEYTAKSEVSAPWSGWGTALKPAWEPVIVARKPLVGTVAKNVETFGTGALNVDGCRIGTGDALVRPPVMRRDNAVLGKGLGAGTQVEPPGRWPANVMLDEDAAGALDAQTGTLTSGKPGRRRKPHKTGSMAGTVGMLDRDEVGFGDSGGASRFFYVAKASRSEREAGLREAGLREAVTQRYGEQAADENHAPRVAREARNTHPTVKPVAVMRWLCRLVTPPGGVILDPFTGSGTTGVAALREGFRFVGIEREAEYVEIARARMAHALSIRQPSLFKSAREHTQEDDR